MDIAVLGTGQVGRTLAEALAGLGHQVTVGTRDPAVTLARREGDLRLSDWVERRHGIRLASLAEAARWSEVVVNATNGTGSLASLEASGDENPAGKVLIDVANPLDFSDGFPPSLSVSNTGRADPAAFPRGECRQDGEHLNVAAMVDPVTLGSGDHTLFVSGNDRTAKASVSDLLRQLGRVDIIDLGDITTARGTEMYLALWVRAIGAIGDPNFNIEVVR